MFAAITGGGTAGHVLPAIAVGEALVAAGHTVDSIQYIGSSRGIETRLLPESGFHATYVDVVGFQRRLDRRNFAFVPKMVTATRSIIKMFEQDTPSVVVSVGGYASMPAVFAARRLGIPIVVVSYDRTPGRASKLAARSAAACAVAFEGSHLPRAEVTGAPVRQSILDVDRLRDRDGARAELGVGRRRFMVTVMGGSLGSGVLNDAIAGYVRDHSDDVGLMVLQIAGERFAAAIGQVSGSGPGSEHGVQHRVVAYESNMAAVYAATDLLVGRGGASTVHEVAVTGTPAILVPWADAAEDHQTANVAWLAQSGGAQMITEAQLGGLGDEIERLRRSTPARDALGAAARALGQVHRSGALAGLIDRVAVTSPPS